jgi:hypothetical protein
MLAASHKWSLPVKGYKCLSMISCIEPDSSPEHQTQTLATEAMHHPCAFRPTLTHFPAPPRCTPKLNLAIKAQKTPQEAHYGA